LLYRIWNRDLVIQNVVVLFVSWMGLKVDLFDRVPVTRVDLVLGVAWFVVVLGEFGVVGVIQVVCVEEFPAFPELV
jgi:hypothetical protein